MEGEQHELLFTAGDVGEYAELTAIRPTMSEMVRPHDGELADRLLRSASNSLVEERVALRLLNSFTEPGLAWSVATGKLVLSAGKQKPAKARETA